jgi:hypothetical protein
MQPSGYAKSFLLEASGQAVDQNFLTVYFHRRHSGHQIGDRPNYNHPSLKEYGRKVKIFRRIFLKPNVAWISAQLGLPKLA